MNKRFGDKLFKGIAYFFGLFMVGILFLMIYQLYRGAAPTIEEYGIGFIFNDEWSPNKDVFGAWPFIYGTVFSSVLALLIATPVSVAIAIYLTEIAPKWLRQPVSFLVELLAAIPSIVYGIWGIFVLMPFVRDRLAPPLIETLGKVSPLFEGPSYGPGLISAGIVLAIMILPTITALSKEVLTSVPDAQREAALALGATRWEMISKSVLTYARSGIIGAMIIGLGRALGETMAVTMVIGNKADTPISIFEPAYTMASVIANEFTEASQGLFISALIEVGLLLFLITFIVNMLARLLVWSFTRGTQEVK